MIRIRRLIDEARANYLRPPGRNAKVLRAAREAVRGAESYQEAWEILDARGLVGGPPYWANRLLRGGNDPRNAALIASDFRGIQTAVQLALEANERAARLLGLPHYPELCGDGTLGVSIGVGKRADIERTVLPRQLEGDPLGTGFDFVREDGKRVVARAVGLLVDGNMPTIADSSPGFSEPRYVARLASLASRFERLRATRQSVRWVSALYDQPNVGLLWSEFENPYLPLLELVALGYASGVAPIMTWVYVPEPTKPRRAS